MEGNRKKNRMEEMEKVEEKAIKVGTVCEEEKNERKMKKDRRGREFNQDLKSVKRHRW